MITKYAQVHYLPVVIEPQSFATNLYNKWDITVNAFVQVANMVC